MLVYAENLNSLLRQMEKQNRPLQNLRQCCGFPYHHHQHCRQFRIVGFLEKKGHPQVSSQCQSMHKIWNTQDEHSSITSLMPQPFQEKLMEVYVSPTQYWLWPVPKGVLQHIGWSFCSYCNTKDIINGDRQFLSTYLCAWSCYPMLISKHCSLLSTQLSSYSLLHREPLEHWLSVSSQ